MSKNVERFRAGEYVEVPIPDPQGKWVLYSDYEHLQSRLAQVEQERDDLRKDNGRLSSVIFNNEHAQLMLKSVIQICKDKAAEWETKRNGLEPLSKMRNRYDAAFCAANDIVAALEKL